MTKVLRNVTMRNLKGATVGLAILIGATGSAAAQNGGLFAPRLLINGQAVTNYEVEQRMLFLRALRAPGDPEKEALDALTRDRLGAQAAKELGISVTAEQVQQGMQEFAARANLTPEEFAQALGEQGIAPETFRDFVANGLLWREVVRSRFGQQVRISEAQIDRALAENAKTPQVRILLSELIIPIQGEDVAPVLDQARAIKAEAGGEAAFAAAARSLSAAPSASRGGRLDWMPIGNLPPAIVEQVLTLSPGEISDPIVVPQAVVLFQLNGISDVESAMPAQVEVEYAQFALPADLPVERIRLEADGCGDLYPIARGLAPERLRLTRQPMGAVPQDIGLDLARLDPGEFVLRGGAAGGTELLMLCQRTGIPADAPPPATMPVTTAETEAADEAASGAASGPAVDREAIRNRLGNQQLTALAEAFMEELRSEAIIKTP